HRPGGSIRTRDAGSRIRILVCSLIGTVAALTMHIPEHGDALREWTSLLGDEHVFRDAGTLASAGTATFATSSRVLAILRPGSRDHVQQAVRIANRHRVPIYPFSTGKNWGYGSCVPARDGVLVDLGRMNRIVAFDEQLAYVTIEPGVTQ